MILILFEINNKFKEFDSYLKYKMYLNSKLRTLFKVFKYINDTIGLKND